MDLFLRNCFQETESFLIAEQEGCVLDGTKATARNIRVSGQFQEVRSLSRMEEGRRCCSWLTYFRVMYSACSTRKVRELEEFPNFLQIKTTVWTLDIPYRAY